MTPRTLNWMLRARGPALHDWPPADRCAAIALMQRCPEARYMLAAALAAEDDPVHDPAAMRRMRNHVHDALAPLPPVLRHVRLGLLVACVVAGLYAGMTPADAELGSPVVSAFTDATPATVLAALDR